MGLERARLPWLVVASFAAAAATVFFCTLNASPLIEPDEARYAEIGREMVVRGDWVTPTLNFVKYFEKPPLVYWLVAANLTVFGQQDWAVRLWSAVFGLVGIAATGLLAAKMFSPFVGLMAAAVLATMPLYFGMSQVASPDMPLAALCTLSLTVAWLSSARWPQRSPSMAMLFWVSLALAILAKGPVAVVLVFGVVTAYCLLTGRWQAWRGLWWAPALLAFCVIAVPWFVIVSWRNPEFFPFFFIEQHVVRYARPWEHREPYWFYIPVVLLGTLPWWIPAVALAKGGRIAREIDKGWASHELIFLYAWFGVVFLFFSFSGSKLGTYILPALPPLAILFARVIAGNPGSSDRAVYGAIAVGTVVVGLGVLAAGRLAPLVSSHHRAELLPSVLVPSALVLLAGGGVVWAITRWQRRRPWLPVAALVSVLWLVEAIAFAHRSIAEHYTPLAGVIRRHWQFPDRIVLYRHYTQGIPYYTGQRVVVVGAWGELEFGRQHEPNWSEYFWVGDERLAEEWKSGRRLFLVVNRSDFEKLAPRLHPVPRELARFRKKLLVANF